MLGTSLGETPSTAKMMTTLTTNNLGTVSASLATTSSSTASAETNREPDDRNVPSSKQSRTPVIAPLLSHEILLMIR